MVLEKLEIFLKKDFLRDLSDLSSKSFQTDSSDFGFSDRL